MKQALILALLTVLLFASCAPLPLEPAGDSKVRKILLLRHAEKTPGTPDPVLLPEGRSRAEFFASWISEPGRGYAAVWSSDYRRTRETAEPIAKTLGADTQIYDPRDLPALAEMLLNSDANTVVVGHSNTTPELAALLCRCEVAPMSEANYEQGYLVTFTDQQRAISQLDFEKLWLDRPAIFPAFDLETDD